MTDFGQLRTPTLSLLDSFTSSRSLRKICTNDWSRPILLWVNCTMLVSLGWSEMGIESRSERKRFKSDARNGDLMVISSYSLSEAQTFR